MKTREADLPESIRPYLNEIADRLWSGRAVVMVGAGFSKNSGHEFPDWNQLGDLFYQKAHGVEPDPARKKYLNVLRLAEEVQAAIGRPSLENLLRSNIPDLNFEPSGLHVELLELPWVDVFTTNYDTLLERGSAKVVTRRYEPVVNKEDIPYAIKPRIVKLHGSFPSERPFIITEEDYRRYPHDYAPFVNTVQQALLENTFCLIGFSGDDPNFLQWIGWIRDNLGKDKTQKIYLVGVFDLSSAKLQLLAQRGIIVVDLSCCQGIEKHDHNKALSKLFEYIRSKKPDALDWPHNPKIIHPAYGGDRIEEVQKITEVWRRQRQSYPGWLILPHSKREKLWTYTEAWINYLPDMEKSPVGFDIQYVYEMIWRLERCLLPIFNNLAEFCAILLNKYWPFQTGNPHPICKFRAWEEKFRDLPWDELRQAWLAISLAILRHYREEGHLEKWKETDNRLRSLYEHLSAEQREFLNYEGFLFSLFTLDLPNAQQHLENWRSIETQPYWMAKRAAAFAEIGLLSEAETLVREALENIRRKLNQKVGTSGLTLVSLESNAMLLGKYIQDAAGFQKNELITLHDKRMQFIDRRNELKGFNCDPWNEIRLFELSLKNQPAQRKDITEKREFDIGRVTKTYHFTSIDQETLNAYAFLRFCEEIGLPFRVGSYTMATKTAMASLQRISRYSFFWATATLVRLGDAKAVDNLFNRESIYKFSTNEADQMIQSYLDALHICWEDIHKGDAFRNVNYGVRLAQLLPEVMSRLCCKCSNEIKHRILEFITELYSSSDKSNYRKVDNLTKRLISSMTEVEQYSLVPYLLKIPFPEDLNLIVKDEFLNPFLLLEINRKPECTPDLEIHPGLVDHLFRQAALDNADRRRWAISSLVTLHNLQLLDNDQSKNLAEAIWCVVDEHGLPEGTDLYKFAFLRLPHPEDIDPFQLFKNYVMNTPFPIQKNKDKGSVTIMGGNIPFVHEIAGANKDKISIWTAEDVIEILQRLIDWWDADKERLNEKESVATGFFSTQEEFKSRFVSMIGLLAEVVAPKLGADSSKNIKKSLTRLLKELRNYGLPILKAEAACLHIYPKQKAIVYHRINEALVSNQESLEKDGLSAIAIIVLDGNHFKTSITGPDPISILNQYLSWKPARSLITALKIIIQILKNAPIIFAGNLEDSTLKRMERLLTETAYDLGSIEMNFDEKLDVRCISSILAAALWKHYRVHNLNVPHVVKNWREECIEPNEFSEIRNPWKACN